MTEKKLTKKEIGVFGWGDMFGGGQIIIAFFYLYFLTGVIGLSPAYAGFIVLISRIWDAISDPLMGVITDGTNSKYGRRRPYMLAGFFGIIVAFTMLWWPITFESQFLTFLYILFTFLFYNTIMTMVMVPYTSFSTELSMDYQERSVVNGTRLFFSGLSAGMSMVLPMIIVGLAPTIIGGYRLMGALFGLFYATPFLFIFFICRERVPITKKQDKVTFSTFIAPFKIKTFRFLTLLYLLVFLSMDIIATIFVYYTTYIILRPEDLHIILAPMFLGQIALLPVVVMMSIKIGKAKTFMYSALIGIVGVILLGSYNPYWPAWSIFAIAAIMGAGLCGLVVMPWTMFPDVTDISELAFGERRAGSFAGIMTFLRKSSSAFAIFLIALALEFAGYVKPIIVNGEKVAQEQSGTLITALRLIVSIIPVIFIIIAIYAAKKYPLSRAIHNKLNRYLKYKRGEEKESNLTEVEVEGLKELLI